MHPYIVNLPQGAFDLLLMCTSFLAACHERMRLIHEDLCFSTPTKWTIMTMICTWWLPFAIDDLTLSYSMYYSSDMCRHHLGCNSPFRTKLPVLNDVLLTNCILLPKPLGTHCLVHKFSCDYTGKTGCWYLWPLEAKKTIGDALLWTCTCSSLMCSMNSLCLWTMQTIEWCDRGEWGDRSMVGQACHLLSSWTLLDSQEC